ncbi:MAG TPA: hypothetical protein DCZ92_10975 [Elusimicrobia bacterium]|nr:hypothetical protein [Elusimicrobiota bacterium]
MRILGTKFFGVDSGVFLLDTGAKDIYAMSTERVTRIKHDWFSVEPVLKAYPFGKIDSVCHSFGDFKNEDTCVETKGGFALLLGLYRHLRPLFQPDFTGVLREEKSDGGITALGGSSKAALFVIKDLLRGYTGLCAEGNKKYVERFILAAMSRCGYNMDKAEFFDHHLCHAASAYYFSPFPPDKKVLVLTLDGQGDGYSSKCFLFEGREHKLLGGAKAMKFRAGWRVHVASLGELYGNFTEALGYVRNSDEGKTEALAAFGQPDPELLSALKGSLAISKDGMTFDIEKLRPFYDRAYLAAQLKRVGRENFSAAIQRFLEDAVVEYLNGLEVPADVEHLCLAGGVAANIILNLSIFERTRFKQLYVFPAMSDCGSAAGAAILEALKQGEDIGWLKERQLPYFGDSYSKDQVAAVLEKYSDLISYEYLGDKFCEEAARAVSGGKIIGLFQGKLEFGPRALGNRSILADARNPGVRDRLNSVVKRRPAFQPFCPSILESERERLFAESFPHKHMAVAFRLKPEFRAALPAIIHVDGTARPQFVSEQDNPPFHRILTALKELTGYGVVLNTSFNLHGRTIVRTPQDALSDFLSCSIDELYLESHRVRRKTNP